MIATTHVMHMAHTVEQDIRFTARSLRRALGFTVAAVLTLALGIGLATAMFSVASTLLLRPLPVRDQDRLVVLWGQSRDRKYDNVPLLGDQTRELVRASRALSSVAFVAREGASPIPISLGGSSAALVRRALVSGSFFTVLGANPALGRALRADDDLLGAAPVAVLSYAGWQHQFGGDPHVVGRHFQVQSTGFDFTVVGVMPRGLDYPRGTEFWAAITPATTAPGNDHSFNGEPIVEVDAVGRLAPGATETAARDELTEFFARAGAPAIDHDVQGVVHSLATLMVGDVKPAVVVFSVAVVLLLFITCINVANLLLIRGIGRMREIAVRSALGASRLRLVRQLLTESVLLAIAGGILGAAVAAGSLRLLIAFAPPDVPRLDEIHVGGATLGAAMAIALLATIVFGIAPALVATQRESRAALRSGTRQSGSRRVRQATEMLVVGQVALALVILSAAGLVSRSLRALERVQLSYDPAHLMVAELTLRRDRFAGKEQQLALLERLLPRVRAIPGVEAVSPVGAAPFTGTGIDFRPALEEQTPGEIAKNPFVNAEAVTADYFATLGISIARGRTFTDADRAGALPVAIVSQSVASRFWPGESAIGKRLKGDGVRTVVGVAPDTRYRDLRDARPTVYIPLGQSPFPFAPTTLAIRARGRPESIVPSLRAAIAEVDAGAALTTARTFDDILAQPLAHPRLNASLLGVFAAAALSLAAIGLFGVMTTMVRQRTQELGVRMALGATSAEIGRLVLGRGARLAAIGVALGLVAAFAGNNLLDELLYHVAPTDAVTLLGSAVALLLLALLAAAIPARASARIAPVVALRSEG
ncbi:MAG: hypothetical protein JWM41_1461 [Gemmatimonadetes bacterium]|nr:hypothetical protein [Gemmatimonadota bacterium]